MKNLLNNIKVIKTQKILGEKLIIINGFDKEIFKVKRFFSINDKKGAIRGEHAHIKCKQFLLCTLGTIKVICKDGRKNKTFILSNPNIGLLIPDGIWSTQYYIGKKNILNVFCDQDFLESDYIRDFDQYLDYYNKL